ncbi:MAG: molybdopterin-binding protein [Anaerolineaceae bacterium]|nr:molybdopterin-binding protein [Anaerolineaceae bacterium]
MPSAEIITIGTELLLGEIQDTNTRYLTRHLRDISVEIYRTTTVGDNADRIARIIREAFTRADIVITTGGLGPTVDDPTRDAVSLAFNVSSEFHPELWKSIEARFLKRNLVASPNNRRQAYIPQGATVIPNPVGTAPSFYYEFENKVLISLPGVPREMETLSETVVFPYLQSKYKLHGIIQARVLHIAGVGESVVDEAIGDLEKLTNPTVGLLAHPGIVDARITAKAESLAEAEKMIAPLEAQIRDLFPRAVFGTDETTLLQALNETAKSTHKQVLIHCADLVGLWPSEFQTLPDPAVRLDESALLDITPISNSTHLILVEVKYYQEDQECHVEISLQDNQLIQNESGIYNGPSAHGPIWAINRALEFTRRYLIQLEKE